MRKLSSLLLLAACELQPGPPRSAPAPAATPPPSAPPAGSAAAGREAKVPFGEQPGAGSGSAGSAAPVRAQVEITAQCLQVGAHLANIVIQSADPAQRSIFETDRDRIVRGAAEVCTTQQWSEPAIKCYLAATSHAATKECETKFPPRPAQPAAGAPGAPGQPAVGLDGKRLEPGTPIASPAGSPRGGSAATPRAGAGSAAASRAGAGSAAAPRASSGAGSAAAPRAGAGSAPRPGAGAGSATAPPAGAGSAAAPRTEPTGGGLMPPRPGSGSR